MKVIIATPGWNLTSEYVRSLNDTIRFFNKSKIAYIWANKYASHVALAREATIMNSEFMDITSNTPLLGKEDYDKILWIDSDISWNIDDVQKILKSPYDMTSGLYLNDRNKIMFSHNSDKSAKELIDAATPFEITHTGFGFFVVNKGVFEAIPRPWFSTEYGQYTQDGKTYTVPYGEDYSFCIKARRAGYKIYLDPTIKVTHHKTTPITPS